MTINIKTAYGGKYDVMEGETLVKMRRAIEDLAAGKITQKKYDEVYESFLAEFPKSTIKILKNDIAKDAQEKEKSKKKSGMNESAKKDSLSGYYIDVSKKGVKVKKTEK